jgi:hypothetical protein
LIRKRMRSTAISVTKKPESKRFSVTIKGAIICRTSMKIILCNVHITKLTQVRSSTVRG